jgi:hypothetical protein
MTRHMWTGPVGPEYLEELIISVYGSVYTAEELVDRAHYDCDPNGGQDSLVRGRNRARSRT